MRRPLLALVLVVPAVALAMEGQWRPAQIPELGTELKEMGLMLPPDPLADVKGKPLGAIVDMDYCSGAFVSPDGLIATAYHCVTDGLQFASGQGEDLMERGYEATDRARERWAGPDLAVHVTTGMSDVTDKVLAGTQRLKGAERLARIDANRKQLVRRCESGPDVHCEVATYGGGASYELVTQLELRDVRLVYAPPRSVGYFGGDQQNWRWPRHAGDFAFLRAYVSPDGHSTKYHLGNVPYHPPVWLPVAEEGVEPGDFVMVAGYPQGTYRWRSAAEVDYAQEEALPLRVTERRDLLSILQKWSKKDPSLAAKLGPRRLNWSNDLVYYRGTLEQLQRTAAAQERWAFEHDLSRWIAADPDRAAKYGNVLDVIHRLQAEQAATAEHDYLVTQMVHQVDLLHAASTIWKLAEEADKPDKERTRGFQNRDRPGIAATLDQADSRFDFRIDRDVLRYFLIRLARLPEGDRVPELSNWLDTKPDEDLADVVDAKLDTLFEDVSLADSDERRDLMGTNTYYLKHCENPWFALAAALQPFLDRMDAEQRRREADWSTAKPLYIQAVQAFYPSARPRYLVASRQQRARHLLPGRQPDPEGQRRQGGRLLPPRRPDRRAPDHGGRPARGGRRQALRRAGQAGEGDPLGRRRPVGRLEARERAGGLPDDAGHRAGLVGLGDDEREG